jgi:beta-glucosidase/6-phospho-beta-glucosidase/beta-galactosidase
MRRTALLPSLSLVAAAVALAACPEEPLPESGFRTAVFPAEFTWGTATAGWQIEGDEGAGGPVASNWSRWMAMGRGKAGQTNPRGNGFFSQYDEDAARAAALGLRSFRLSIDWSRIEPEPGVFDEAELDHLDDVLQSLVDHGLEPVVSLWHWTVPLWVQDPDAGGPNGKVDRIATKDRSVVDDFEAFVRVVIPRIKDKVDVYTVLNEPMTMVVVAYIDGSFPPGEGFNIPLATDFGINLMYMHARAFAVIKELDDADADGDGAASFVGLTMTANDIYPENPQSAQEQLAAESLNYVYNDWIIRALTTGELDVDLNGEVDPAAGTNPPETIDAALANTLEFIGVQYYGPVKVKEVAFLNDTPPLYGLPLVNVESYSAPEDRLLPRNGMGREIDAAGFADTLDRYARWGLPIIVTENGTTVNRAPEVEDPAVPLVFDDTQAAMYLVTHLWEVGRAIARGIDIRGYYHWTLADNYEWVEGRLQRFGAYTVDFDDAAMPRTKNKMGEALEDIVGANAVTEEIWNRWVADRFPTDETSAGRGATTREPPIAPPATR